MSAEARKAARQHRNERLQRTVAMVAFSNAGLRAGIRGVSFLVCWGIASEDLGHPANMRDYGRWWEMSDATAYRDREAFQKAFPGQEMPAELWAAVRDQIPSRERVTASAEAMSAVLAA